ncbi:MULTISPECIES: hypothetical protein [unclassified Microcoleus]|uniref:hypothetical protein n=1 Tax=unclassified Microcoleus TaxID=2642155 RepID=UPI002FD62E15
MSSGIGAKVSSNKKVIANQTEKVKLNITNIQQWQQNYRYTYFNEKKLIEYINSAIKIIKSSAASKIFTYEEMKYIDLAKDVKEVFIKMNIAQRYPNILETIDELDKRACKFSSGQLIDLALQKWLERL